MKTWLTYLAAAAMGLAFELTFKDSTVFLSVMYVLSEVVLKIGIFIVFPLAFFTMASGTASLSRRKGHFSFVLLSTIFWAAVTSMVLSVLAVFIFRLFPAAFPVTSTTPESAGTAASVFSSLSSSTALKLDYADPLSVNSFVNFIKSSDCLLPVIAIALVFGYAIRPTSEVVRPAYITLNSISEVMFRLARKLARFLWIAIFFIAGTWFDTMWADGTVFVSWRFTTLLCLAAVLMLFAVIPLIYALATGFRRNPYRQITRLLSAATAAFFSDNYLFSQSTLYTDCRVNLGIQKNVVSTALPIHSILTKGGTALVSTLCTCALVFSASGSMPTVLQTVTIAFACTLMSFISCIHAGYEVVVTVAFALNILNVSVQGAEYSILGLLPLINGLALLFDVMLAGLGTSFSACHLGADCHIKAKDTI